MAAGLGLREQVSELPLVDDSLGTEQGSQGLLTQIRVGCNSLPFAKVNFLPHLAACQSERSGLAPVHQVQE